MADVPPNASFPHDGGWWPSTHRTFGPFMDGLKVECAIEHCALRNFASDAVSLGPIVMREPLADSYSQEDIDIVCQGCRRSFGLTLTSDLDGLQIDCPPNLPREAVFYRISKVELIDNRDPEMKGKDEPEWEGDPNPGWGVER